MILLKKLRSKQGLSRFELSKKCGVDDSVIGNIENGKYKTKTNNMIKLAKYFGISEPLELIKNVNELLKAKKCQNQRCLLNRECYCQSERVIEGESCMNQNLIIPKMKEVSFNNIIMIDKEKVTRWNI